MVKKNKLDTPEVSFETALTQLESIVDKLESGAMDLDAALLSFEEGMKLAKQCQARLNEATGRVEKIMKSYEGEEKIVEAPEFIDDSDVDVL